MTLLSAADAKIAIDAFIEGLIDRRVKEAGGISPDYGILWQAISTVFKAGGKRLRPYLTLLAYKAFGGKGTRDILPAAAAQELLHIGLLIHDDIIDRDLIRHGQANITGLFLEHYHALLSNEAERRHFAESAAMLAGDLLISQAHLLIAETPAAAARVLQAQQILEETMFHVIGGELLDTEAAFRTVDRADPLLIAREKTASYSFVTPLRMGAALAGAAPERHEVLRELGVQLGIGFQLRDDLIGVFGDESISGKSAQGDIREGKQTLLVAEFHQRADKKALEEFGAAFGNAAATPGQIQRARQLLRESGARQAVETAIDGYRTSALRLLDELDFAPQYRAVFASFIERALTREA